MVSPAKRPSLHPRGGGWIPCCGLTVERAAGSEAGRRGVSGLPRPALRGLGFFSPQEVALHPVVIAPIPSEGGWGSVPGIGFRRSPSLGASPLRREARRRRCCSIPSSGSVIPREEVSLVLLGGLLGASRGPPSSLGFSGVPAEAGFLWVISLRRVVLTVPGEDLSADHRFPVRWAGKIDPRGSPTKFGVPCSRMFSFQSCPECPIFQIHWPSG